MISLEPFEPNSYRKRVLAAVEARGGPQTSDPFELYDIPLDSVADLTDSDVEDRVAEVWAFWQRQRDHPKYRVLVAALVASHDANSAVLLDAKSRADLVEHVRQQRAGHDAARYELFDSAVAALVARHGGIPQEKLAKLGDVGRDSGLTESEVAARLRRHHVIDLPAKSEMPAGDLVPPSRRRQIRAQLDELGRIWESPPPPTLFALLRCEPDADDSEIAARAAAWRSRARELPSDRLRTVIDELLVHVADLLEADSAVREAYLDGVAVDAVEKLRPRVRAAVLVEDRLTADDHAHLVAEAGELGLDAGRASRVLAALAAEFGAPVDTTPRADPRREPAPVAQQRRQPGVWSEPLRAARKALRDGRPVAARSLAEEARQRALPDRQPSIAAVADEIDSVLADARLRWLAAAAALKVRRYVEVTEHLEHLTRVASDVPDPDGALDAGRTLADARAAVAEADRLVEAAKSGPDAALEAGMLAALDACPEHPGALAALAALPLGGPASVTADRGAGGDVTIRWEPAPGPAVTYKITRLEPDGTWRTVGRTGTTSMTDGGAGTGAGTPVYAVVALRDRRSSGPVRSDGPALAEPDAPAGAPPAPRDVRSERSRDGSVLVSWAPPEGSGDVEYKVTRRTPDGAWRVVGRTRGTSIEDGGAPAGELPEYGVVATPPRRR